MSVELATAWVSIVPSTKGIAGQIRKDVGGPLEGIVTQAGVAGGRGFASNLAAQTVSGLDSMGSSIVDSVTKWTRRAAIAGGAILGVGLFAGMKRTLDTEDARKTFGQLGASVGETDDIMRQLQGRFETGPFAYPDVYDVSSQLFASGVGMEKLVGWTGAVGDLAAFAQEDLSRVGEITSVIGAQGKVSARELNRLSQMGVPMRQILAEALGVSGEQLADMVSNGEVTSEMFFEAISSADQFTGAMDNFADTTRGAWSVMKAGIAGAGEALLAPWFGENGTMVGFLKSVNEWIFDRLQPTMERWGQWLYDEGIPALQGFGETLSEKVIPPVERVVGWLIEHREEIGRVVSAVAPAVGIVSALAVSISLVNKAIALSPVGIVLALVSGLIYAWQNSERFQEVVTATFEAVRQVVGPIIARVVGWLMDLAGLLGGGGEPSQRMTQFRDHAASIWESVQAIFASGLELIDALFGPIVEGWSTFWAEHGDKIMAVAGFVWDTVVNVIDTALSILHGVIETALGVVTGDWGRAWDGIKRQLGAAWDGLLALLRDALTAMRGMFGDRVDALIAWTRMLPARIIAAVASLVVRGRTWARDVVASMRSAMVDRVASLIGWVRGVPLRIVRALGNVSRLLYDAGRKIITGLKDGIVSAFKGVKDSVSGGLSSVKRLFPSSPAKEGPFSGKGWTLHSGRSIAEGLAEGIQERARLVEASTRDLAALARAQMEPALVGSDAAVAAPAAQGDAPISLTLDLGEGITQRYRIERTREGQARAVRLGAS